MPRKKQQCGFRIPWISESHTPSAKKKPKSLSTHRPPFRPPGIASITSQAAPQKVSNSLPSSHSPAPSVVIDSPNVKELELDSTPTQNSNDSLETESKTHQSKSNGMERKMMFATSTPSGKDVKFVAPASKSATIPLSNEDMQKESNDISGLNPALKVDDKTVSVVTLAGENRGVTMHVAGSHSTRPKDEAGKTYVNSNIQSINNSIMSYGSIDGRDPGVRVILPQHSQPEPSWEKQKPKAQVSINRLERVPYRPVVRRRCLRGLFLEPSDSEPDKPRRHGCKFPCGDNTKDTDPVTK